ncbi:MAG: hypothetical protein KatS3mg026_0233 [Bacteroidia bacterium]|nr:MAG: hypothetical protein KatS3mg026_0233 [Bacteroidia bacterium]
MTTADQRIQVLPESVINQIAAGEVVLRPASVIKELGENAVDAEAQHISIWTEQGGKSLIQVTDDGVGMSPLDAELCFERHATSKIRSAQDLYALYTKGFRGEALASIAAVAEVELFTRRLQDTIGTHVVMAFGQKVRVEPLRCAAGTTVIVRRLFQRLPVRRKSLRSDATEHRHNVEEFLRLVYPHPERHFRFYHNQALLYDLPPASLRERILALYPELSAEDLVPVEGETPFFTVRGYLVLPEKIPAGHREAYLFINQRYIRHALLQQGLLQVYRPLLLGETRPLYWLFLEVPPQHVDVNVTPSKTEARLLHELEVRTMLTSMVRKALAQSHLTLPVDWLLKPTETLEPALKEPLPAPSSGSSRPLPQPSRAADSLPLPEVSARLSYLLLHGRYLVLEWEGQAWLVDVRAAHERILYEQHLNRTRLSPQGLLFPVHARLSPQLAARLAELRELLQEEGFHLEVREGKEAVLHALPAGVMPGAAAALLDQLLALLQEPELPPDWRNRLAQHVARYGSPRPPYTLSAQAVEKIWSDLLACSDPTYTPSGRRIRYLLTEEVLEKLFS